MESLYNPLDKNSKPPTENQPARGSPGRPNTTVGACADGEYASLPTNMRISTLRLACRIWIKTKLAWSQRQAALDIYRRAPAPLQPPGHQNPLLLPRDPIPREE